MSSALDATRDEVVRIVGVLQTTARALDVNEILIATKGRRRRLVKQVSATGAVAELWEDESSDDELDADRERVSHLLEVLAATPLISVEPRKGDQSRKRRAYRYRWGYDLGPGNTLDVRELQDVVGRKTEELEALKRALREAKRKRDRDAGDDAGKRGKTAEGATHSSAKSEHA